MEIGFDRTFLFRMKENIELNSRFTPNKLLSMQLFAFFMRWSLLRDEFL